MNELNIVSQILDSTYNHPSKSASYSLKHSLNGNTLELRYSTIVHFASEHGLHKQMAVLRDRSSQIIDNVLSNLKSDFREMADKTLKIEDMGGKDDLELISATSNSLRKVAYYKCNRVLELSV